MSALLSLPSAPAGVLIQQPVLSWITLNLGSSVWLFSAVLIIFALHLSGLQRALAATPGAANDAQQFYRADNLLKEADLVLEATCRACQAGRPAGDGLASRR